MNIFENFSPLVASQILGAIGIIVGLTVYAGKTRPQILACKFVSDAIWSANYLLVGGYTGSLLNAIGMVREVVFYHRGTKKWASNRFWLYLFAALALLSPIMEWVQLGSFSWLPLLPACGSTCSVFSLYSRRPRTMRILGIVTQLFWITYGIILSNVTSVLSSTMLIISAIIGMIREAVAERKQIQQQ